MTAYKNTVTLKLKLQEIFLTMKRSQIIKIVYSALFAALIFVGTQFIKVPLPIGYFNLGDPFILTAGCLVGGAYAAVAAAIGAGLADLLSGYAIYAPATVIIKALMALVVFAFCRKSRKSTAEKYLFFIIGSAIAEIIMVVGYYLFESVLYGFAGAAVSIPGNLLQGVAGVIVSTVIIILIDKTKIGEHMIK